VSKVTGFCRGKCRVERAAGSGSSIQLLNRDFGGF